MFWGGVRGGQLFEYALGKTFLGKANSFAITVYGTNGAISWTLEDPDRLIQVISSGETFVRDRAWAEDCFPEIKRLSRFKSGHPSGFVEALANYYSFVLDHHLGAGQNEFPVTEILDVEHYMSVLEASVVSARSGTIVNVEQDWGI